MSELSTPCYHYNLGLLRRTLSALTTATDRYGYQVHYAMKANANEPILKEVLDAGLGVDCVSGNEIITAITNGFTPEQIVFAGVGKTDEDILIGLRNGIHSFNVESLPELEVIAELAAQEGRSAHIALRMNPNVDAHTHQYITTGLQENKFGINLWELDQAIDILTESDHLNLVGLHFHIGSQIVQLGPYKELCTKVNAIQEILAERGVSVDHINLGGGLGIDYQDPVQNPIVDFDAFFAIFNDFLDVRTGQQVHFELGRSIVGQCGTLLTRVLYLKKGMQKNFLIVDAGMTELLRPALYQSVHALENITSESDDTDLYDVVGPICESSDCFGKSVRLPESGRGDIIAIRSVGAYGEVMAMNYNMRNGISRVYEDGPVTARRSALTRSLQS